MPFCPSIIENKSHQVLMNKKETSDYMTSSFKVNKSMSKKLFAGIHHGDKTMRPQILRKIQIKSIMI